MPLQVWCIISEPPVSLCWSYRPETSTSGIFVCVTFKFYRWSLKTMGYLFCATWSFVHIVVAIGEFKLELESWKHNSSQNGWFIFSANLNFDGWPWKKVGHFSYATSSAVHYSVAICEIKLSYSPEMLNLCQHWPFFVPCDLVIWRMILQTIEHLWYATSSFGHNFVAICEFKLELGLQSGNAQFRSKLVIFVPCDWLHCWSKLALSVPSMWAIVYIHL